MNKYTISDIPVTIKNGNIPEQEATAYVIRGRELYGHRLVGVTASVDEDDPEYVNLDYQLAETPFHRLRRITGYLVGTLGRWNNGKRAEERDRVKHGVEETE